MTHRPAYPLPKPQIAMLQNVVGNVELHNVNVNMDVHASHHMNVNRDVKSVNEPSCMWNNYLKEQVRP